MWLNSLWTRPCERSNSDLLGLVEQIGRLAGTLPAEPRDLLADADEAAQRPHLVDDPRVVRRVRRRRDERGELVDPRPAADVLELAALLELVDERDRVDGLALRVERERGAVDLGVALAVEVAGVEDLADRPDRAGGEHHRPEHRLLGLEVLRRDRGGLRRWDGLDDHYAGVETPRPRAQWVCTSGRVLLGRLWSEQP